MSSLAILIEQINDAASICFLTISIVNFLLGAFGLLINIYVFTRPTLRQEPCSMYFLISSCYNLFVVFVVMPVRVLSNAYNISASNYNFGICKFEYFIFYATRATSIWLILLACIDRFLHSSPQRYLRQLSSMRTAKLAITIASILVPILYSHMIAYYELYNVTDANGDVVSSCRSRKGFYSTFFGFSHMVVYSLCPSFFMLTFGFLTIRNTQKCNHLVRRITAENIRTRRTNSQLLRMLTAQVLVIIIATLPFSIYQLYASFTSILVKDTLRIAQENLFARITGIMTYFAHSSSFYLYTLTGTIFRKEAKKIFRHASRVHTIDTEQQVIHVLQFRRQQRQ
ncbi:unnamed protein product [Adineta ricciae]|uniref:G-protein coupled receptors family 1 profile domain-containing protein n=1 Tax=Adineta ricciae TaxID=249248 RepID=A0A815EIE4_ADIRI|nr:unnamed protein product [Adineta ricciae]CAF1307153.1 unnamed protein product [Adineta ricciae]